MFSRFLQRKKKESSQQSASNLTIMGHQDLVLNVPLEHNWTYFIAPRIHALAVLQSMDTLAESLSHKVSHRGS